MSCLAGCPTCAPAKPACAARSRRSTPSSPTVSCTSNSPTTLTASSPSCATRPTCPASRSANACCGWSSKTSSSAPTRSPSVTASRSATTPTPATPTPRPSPPRRATTAQVIHCVGGVLSPLLSNLALSVLDEHFTRAWQAWAPPLRRGRGIDAKGWRPGGWSATRTISSCWWPAAVPMPRRCVRRSQRSLPRWGFGCRRRKRRSPTSTRASIFSGSASSGTQSEARASATSTPTRPRRRWQRSRRSSGRSPGRTETSRSPSCCTSSTRCCEDGPATSSTGCLRRPSTTCAPSSGGGWSAGCVTSTLGPVGSGCGGATFQGGGRPTGRSRWSTRARWWSAATATGQAASPHRGPSSRDRTPKGPAEMGSWRAGCVATRTSGSAARAGETDRPKRRHRAPARPIHLKVRLEEQKLCLLVIIGVRADGTKELVALADGYRESGESWADLLRDAKRRGMRAPVLAIGDGALGFWAGLREVFPEAREQRCWFHKTGNVLSALPKSAHPAAKKALTEIWRAEDKAHARAAAKVFADLFGAKFPKAVAKITDDLEQLLAFYDYPAEHWVHLRTTNPIESTFAAVRHRTKITRGPGSRAAGLAMAFKLIESAQTRWRAVHGAPLVTLVRAGATFVNGKLIERSEDQPAQTPIEAAA